MMTAITSLPKQKKRDLPSFPSTSSDTLAIWSNPEEGAITTQGNTGCNGIIRWYDPITGRWLSNDPIGISGGLNQYVFCGDNPVNRRDPLGLLSAADVEKAFKHPDSKEALNLAKWVWKNANNHPNRPTGGFFIRRNEKGELWVDHWKTKEGQAQDAHKGHPPKAPDDAEGEGHFHCEEDGGPSPGDYVDFYGLGENSFVITPGKIYQYDPTKKKRYPHLTPSGQIIYLPFKKGERHDL